MKRQYSNFPLFIFLLIISLNQSCNTSPDGLPPKEVAEEYLRRGDSIVKVTFDTLRQALTQAMADKGLPGAVLYCNEQAYPITNMLSNENIRVKRVAEKTRNPQNKLDSLDRMMWENYTRVKEKAEAQEPVVLFEENKVHYYKPILLQPMCTSCHGQVGTNIPSSLATIIDSIYPADKAKGFKPGDLRGLWHIEFSDYK